MDTVDFKKELSVQENTTTTGCPKPCLLPHVAALQSVQSQSSSVKVVGFCINVDFYLQMMPTALVLFQFVNIFLRSMLMDATNNYLSLCCSLTVHLFSASHNMLLAQSMYLVGEWYASSERDINEQIIW